MSWIEIGIHQYFSQRSRSFCLRRLRPGVLLGVRLCVTVVLLSRDAALIYFHLSSLPINSCGMLSSFKATASCCQPLEFDVEVLLRSKSFIRSTTCVLEIVVFFSINSPFSLQRIFGFVLLLCQHT